MKNSAILIAVMLLLCITRIQAQVIPDSLRVDWSKAGYQGSTPQPSLVINVKDFGAYGDSVHDDYAAIINAMNSSNAPRVIYFPAGNYLIKTSIIPSSNVVFRGDGTTSNLIFNLINSTNKNAINISPSQNNTFTPVNSGYTKGSSVLNLASTAGFAVGSYAEIREANGSWDTKPAAWAINCVGQMVKIIAIDGNQITIDQPLRITYDNNLKPEIRPVNLRCGVGFEYLKFTRVDTIVNGNYGYNINFTYAADCWVNGVEFSKSQAAHIMLQSSKNITISGSYFHDAFTYDGTSTAGYGIVMIQHNSDCKVENNVFRHLRHSMIAKQGANGNVFAYNYSFDPYRSETPHDSGGDMVLHGHYPFANLFEGNIGQTIMVDDTWGPAGPYNTFFRNRADLYGISIYDASAPTRKENVVGNEVTNGGFMKGAYFLQANYHFTYDNNIRNTIQPKNTNNLSDSSYYLTAQPSYWNITSAWPSIGGDNALSSGSNPAKERYLSGSDVTVNAKPVAKFKITITADSIKCNGGTSHIVITATGGTAPYKGTGDFYKTAGSYSFVVTDATNKKDSVLITLQQPLPLTATANTIASETCTPNGSIAITSISNGVAPFAFSLNGNDYTNDSSFTKLTAGKYFVTIKDSIGCLDSINNIVVDSKQTIVVTAKTTTSSLCRNDGSITVKRSGGASPFTYSIDGINYSTSALFSNLAAGTYTAYVKDKKGCTDSLQNVIVAYSNPIYANIKKTNLTCKNADDGSITIKAGGGAKSYLYSIDSVNYFTSNVFSNLKAGDYTTYTKDTSGCMVVATTTIKNSNASCTVSKAMATTLDDVIIAVAPNPTTQRFTITVPSKINQAYDIYVSDLNGKIVFKVNDETKNTITFGDNFSAGIYIMKFVQGDVSKTYKLVKQ